MAIGFIWMRYGLAWGVRKPFHNHQHAYNVMWEFKISPLHFLSECDRVKHLLWWYSPLHWLRATSLLAFEQVPTSNAQGNENTQKLGLEKSRINGLKEIEKKKRRGANLRFLLVFAQELDWKKERIKISHKATIFGLKKTRRENERMRVKWEVLGNKKTC